MEKTAEEDVYLARIAKTRLQKALVGNGNLRKLRLCPQHGHLLGAELAGCLDRAYLADGHGFVTAFHAVHLTGGPQQVTFARGTEPIEQIPNGSRGALLEAALTPTRTDDKERKGSSPEASQSAGRSKSSREWISLSVEKEVLNRVVRTGGLPPANIDQ
jgi:hypothetical protein